MRFTLSIVKFHNCFANIHVVMWLYGANLVYILLNRKGTNKSRSTEVKNIAVNPEVHHIGQYGFQFGYVLTDPTNKPIQIDNTYFEVSIEEGQTTGIYGQNSTRHVTPIPSKPWGEDFEIAKDFIRSYGDSLNLLCPMTANSSISGNFLSNNYRTIIIKVGGDLTQFYRWQNVGITQR